MPMVTYQQLWAVDPTSWRRAGAAWGGVVELVRRHGAAIAAAAADLAESWSSPAGRAGDAALRDLRARLNAGLSAFIEIDQILAEQAALLAEAKAMLDAAVTSAIAAGLQIDRYGVVTAGPAASGQDQTTIREATASIGAALEHAATADREAARRLADLTAAALAGWPAEPPVGPPPPATADPAVVRDWWAGLTPPQRRWLVEHEPALIGRLDGIPVAVRDQANRLMLEDHRAALMDRRARLWPDRFSPGTRAELARVNGALTGLAAIEERLAADSGPRAYLLGLDPAGDGRIVVAVGNPDRANNVLTYVPGMTADLRSASGELQRALRVMQRCAELAPAEQTAAVLWLDYDAPDSVHEAFRSSFARDAGSTLHRFQEGLRVTHDGPAAHQTVLGHSYGSLVVGTTARDWGLAADSVVFVGSPGVGVDRAADLDLPPGQVWSTTARNDIIQYAAPSVDQALKQIGIAALVPAAGPLLALTPDDELWFGRNPSDPGFGGRVFGGASRGHTGYWDPDNPALDNMARITLGGEYQVTVR